MSDVHLAARNPATKKIGSLETPLEQVMTVCKSKWATRPQRTTLVPLVTCSACIDFIAKNRIRKDQLYR